MGIKRGNVEERASESLRERVFKIGFGFGVTKSLRWSVKWLVTTLLGQYISQNAAIFFHKIKDYSSHRVNLKLLFLDRWLILDF